MTIDSKLRAVIDRFDFPGSLVECQEIKTGHINRTYRLRYEQSGRAADYVLQRINNYVFKKPWEVMENVQLVTEHLRAAMRNRGIDPENRVLKLVRVKTGGAMVDDGEDGFWRAYEFIRHATTIDRIESPGQFRQIGAAFGQFQGMLSDFPIERLHDTIPHFHDTRKRVGDFEHSVALDVAGRAAGVQADIAFIRSRGEAMCRIVDMLKSGEMPLRVTHNDTKINNVMLDVDTGEALCVIDLDTVMPGSALYDFGDAIRYGASTAAEDETDLDKVSLDMDLFTVFSEGFIANTAARLTDVELKSLPLGALVMTYENALRFLADYLDGDTYYKIDYPAHNLDRARCQCRLLADMEANQDSMYDIVAGLCRRFQ